MFLRVNISWYYYLCSSNPRMIRNIAICIFSLHRDIKFFTEKSTGISNKYKNLIIIRILFGTQIAVGGDSIKYLNELKDLGRFRYLNIKGHYGKHLYAGRTVGDLFDTYGSFKFSYGWQCQSDKTL